MDYQDFVKTKVKHFNETGFEIDESQLNPMLMPFQKWCVRKALSKGRFALWADCGLGKTFMQLEYAKHVSIHTRKPVLILCPLAVGGQTILQSNQFKFSFVDKYGQLHLESPYRIDVSNYEQLDNIDCTIYGGVVLDESSILKNFSGATRNKLIEYFIDTQYKLCCTATPSPNDELEIGNHAEFLNICTSQDMRALYFTTDKEIIKGNKYRLKKHAEKDFFRWISSWAVMFSKPSHIGFLDNGYILPPLNFIEKKLTTPKKDNGLLFNSVSVSATNHNEELRLTMEQRMQEVAAIVNNSDEAFVIWVKLNDEEKLLQKLISDAVIVTGADSIEHKEEKLIGFSQGKFRVIVTKPSIASFGLNWQHCHNQIFASLDFSFESLYQSIRRSYRFGQYHEVNIYLITTDTMQNVILSIEEKQEKFIRMQEEMRTAILENYHIKTEDRQRKEVEFEQFKLVQNDCIEELATMADNSIDYSFFSPPFAAMYVFSNDPKDMSNVGSYDEFLQHFSYLPPQLLRVLKPGRLISMHIMQSTTLLGREGYYSIKDFRGDLIRIFEKAGFYFHEEHGIRKDPKTAAIRTKNRQLMWGTTKKDSTIVRPGLADFIISFKKPGDNEVPVVNDIPFDLWCQMAEPFWMDIEEGDTLEFRSAKENDDERHLTPTQLKPIEWCYLMYSNKGDTVLSPYSGIASEGYQAVKMGRKYIGIELKESYYNVSIRNCKMAVESQKQISLFQPIKEEVA